MAQPDLWTQWQHTLLVDVHGAVLSQAGLAWEMSVPSAAWPFSHVPLIQELELEGEDGLQRMAKLPCQCSSGDCSWILSQVNQDSFKEKFILGSREKYKRAESQPSSHTLDSACF